LNALDQFGDFFGRLCGFFRQLPDFIGYNCEAESVFAGARRFNGSVQREQVGLLGEIVDNFNDLTDVICALAERVDDLA